jgi:hypothetical protein
LLRLLSHNTGTVTTVAPHPWNGPFLQPLCRIMSPGEC